MKSKICFLTAIVCAGMLFCSFVIAQKISYDIPPGNDFSKYKTYKWDRADDATYPADNIDQMLKRSIDAQLAQKGLKMVESEPCDLIMIYQLAILDDIAWASYRTNIGWQAIIGSSTIPSSSGPVTGTN